MDSFQSFRAASSSDSLGEEKKCNEHADDNVPDAAFDDILTTVRKEEWYTVSHDNPDYIAALLWIPDWHVYARCVVRCFLSSFVVQVNEEHFH